MSTAKGKAPAMKVTKPPTIKKTPTATKAIPRKGGVLEDFVFDNNPLSESEKKELKRQLTGALVPEELLAQWYIKADAKRGESLKATFLIGWIGERVASWSKSEGDRGKAGSFATTICSKLSHESCGFFLGVVLPAASLHKTKPSGERKVLGVQRSEVKRKGGADDNVVITVTSTDLGVEDLLQTGKERDPNFAALMKEVEKATKWSSSFTEKYSQEGEKKEVTQELRIEVDDPDIVAAIKKAHNQTNFTFTF